MLQFKDPTKLRTQKIVFEAIFSTLDPGTLEHLKDLSSKRMNVELINNNIAIPNVIAREISGGLASQCEQDVQKLELYLPVLENLIHHIDLLGNDDRVFSWTSKLKIRWTSPLRSSCSLNLGFPKFFQIDDLRFELGSTLFLYGSMLREWASQVLVTADLVQSATLFRKAGGVYHYLGHHVLPSLKATPIPYRPPEARCTVSSIMSLICLAEAQVVTILKAEEKKTVDGLLSKLHYGVVQLLDEAFAFYSKANKDKDMSPGLMVYILSTKDLHNLRSYKHMAQGFQTDGQIGTAIGLLKQALNGKLHRFAKHTGIKQEINTLTELLRKYEHENDFVYNEKVPHDHHLPLLQGKKIATCIPYCPLEKTLKLRIF